MIEKKVLNQIRRRRREVQKEGEKGPARELNFNKITTQAEFSSYLL
jgi:hypothetical protein